MASTTVVVSVTVGVKRKRGDIDGPKQFVCDSPGCGKICASKSRFTRHQRSHLEQNAPPTSFEDWKQHYKYKHIFGIPDGRVWSCESGRFLEGNKFNGYVRLSIEGKGIQKHRLNFEIANGRAIGLDMEVDHIVPSREPEDGSERLPPDDSWANLQELTSEEHHLKTRADNPEAGKTSGLTQGFPVFALHVASGIEKRHDSIRVAASALNLSIMTIARRIGQGSSKEVGGHVFRRCPDHVAEQADKPGEVWKDAIYYGVPIRGVRVSSMGRVQLSDGRRTKGAIRKGRHCVGLRVDNEDANVQVYNLVAHTFISPPPTPKHTVDHIDGDCQNDVLSNLCWATQKEQGRNKKNNRAVSKYDLQEGKLLQTYGTIAEAAEDSCVSERRVVYAAKTGGTRTGCIWKYVEQRA
jgi:hypothetical protein